MNTRWAVGALVAAPLVGLGAVLLGPDLGATGAQRLAAVDGQGGRFLWGNVLLIGSFLLILPGLALLGRALRARGSRWGGAMALASCAGWALHIGIIGFVLAQLPLAAAATPDAAALADALFDSPAFMVLLLPMLAATMLGMPLLFVAAWRAGLAPLASVLLLVAALAVDLAELPAPYGGAIFHGLLATSLVPVARRLKLAGLGGTTPAPAISGGSAGLREDEASPA